MQKLKLITRQQGFTIVEVLISLALVAMLTLAIFGASSVMRRSYDRNTKNNYNLLVAKSGLSQISEALRYAKGVAVSNGTATVVNTDGSTTTIVLDTVDHSLNIGTKSIAEPLVSALTFTQVSTARILVSMDVVDPSAAKITANPKLTMRTTVRMLNVTDSAL
jgi:prepilin-type N-terminal cleavage/methylation domain-containing protein